MLSISLNSHSLSSFSTCKALFDYRELQLKRPIRKKAAFEKGTLVARVLELFYKKKQRLSGAPVPPAFVGLLYRKMQGPTIKLATEDKMFLAGRFLLYAAHYQTERFKVVAVELGFSTLLYEDKKYQFIYEGRPDLVIGDGQSLIVVDHKTRLMERMNNDMNNQSLGYCYCLGAKTFIYNYIGLQTSEGPQKWFKRTPVEFSARQLLRWRDETIETFFEVARTMETKKFGRSYNCVDRYGMCDYYPICSAPSERDALIEIQTGYETVERHKSW